MALPHYVTEANLDDPVEAIYWAICEWPKVGKTQPYPAAPEPILEHHAQLLSDLGFVYHPELAKVKKVPGEDGRPTWIPVGDPDPAVPASSEPNPEVMAMLSAIDPDLAAGLQDMTADERLAALEEARKKFDEAISLFKSFDTGE